MTEIAIERGPAVAEDNMSPLLAGSLRREEAMQRLIQSGSLGRSDLKRARELLARQQALSRYIRTLNL